MTFDESFDQLRSSLMFSTYLSSYNMVDFSGHGPRVMPSAHLPCDESTEPVSCPWSPERAASVQAAAVRLFTWIHGHAASTIMFNRTFYKLGKKCKPVARRRVEEASCGQCAGLMQRPRAGFADSTRL